MGTRPTRTRLQYRWMPQAVYPPCHGMVLYGAREPILECHTPDGELIRRIRIALDPIPVSFEDRQAVLEAYDDYLQVLRQGREGPEG